MSHAECFPIGHIGRLEKPDMEALLAAIKATLGEMDIELRGAAVASES